MMHCSLEGVELGAPPNSSPSGLKDRVARGAATGHERDRRTSALGSLAVAINVWSRHEAERVVGIRSIQGGIPIRFIAEMKAARSGAECSPPTRLIGARPARPADS